MPIIAKSNDNAPREPMPSGNYAARCYQMLHIGTNTEMINGSAKTLNKVRIGWEIPELTKVFDEAKGPQPLVISQEYTLSLSQKANLRAMLKSWRGSDFTDEEAENFDITAVLGKPCMINVVHKPSAKDPKIIYEQIAGVTPLPKGLKCPPLINPLQELNYDSFNHELCESLPDFIKNKVKSSEEYRAMKDPHHVAPTGGGSQEEEDDDSIPF